MNSKRLSTTIRGVLASVAAAAIVLGTHSITSHAQGGRIRVARDLRDRAARDGRVRVLVELNVPGHIPDGRLPNILARLGQRQRVSAIQARVLSRLSGAPHRVVHRYETLPYIALDVDAGALTSLDNDSNDVVQVLDDTIVRPVLAESAPLVQADQAWAAGYDGTGTTIAILDTGVESSHPFLAGKVVEEACYSGDIPGLTTSFCPNGLSEQIGPGAATPCWLDGCYHGTHVAGIAAGNGAGASMPFSGVAKGANIMAVQVFSQIDNVLACGGIAPCLGGFTSDILAGLERVYTVAASRNVVAVNMSLGEGQFFAQCDAQPYKPLIDSLRSIGVASVAAAGNDGHTTSMMTPACVSTAVSVGATDKNDEVAWFSNASSFMSLWAPGVEIVSSVTDGGFELLDGTSMASPHVAGAWAVLKQAAPNASVTDILDALRTTGKPVHDNRAGGTVTAPRINIYEALATLASITNPPPAITSLSPDHAHATAPALTLTVSGSGFNAFSKVHWNGAERPTKVVNVNTLQASIPGSDLPSAGVAEITVVTAPPGGGTSNPVMMTITPPPSITIDSATVAPNGLVTMTLHDGFGGANDWLSFASVGSENTSRLQWRYVGAGIETRTWTIAVPTAEGQYEFRYFLDNGYVLKATSPSITVATPPNPVPAITSLSPTHTPPGSPGFTLTVNGTNFVQASVVRWNGVDRSTTYVNASQLRAAVSASDVAATGTAAVSVFSPAPGGGLSEGVTFTIDPPPSLEVSATSVAGNTPVTVTVTNGFGGTLDWLALAATTAPNTTYLQWTYIGAGVTNRTWTIAAPTTPGTYEFRVFVNGYTRVATSATITVLPPAPSATSLSPTASQMGSAAFTLTVNGSNFTTSSVVQWNGSDRATTYVSASQLRAAILASDIASVGTATVTVFNPPPGGGTSAGLIFTINQAPSLTVSTTTAAGGSQVTVTLANGSGATLDWLALAATTAPNTSYLQWTYVGSGVTNRTWTIVIPTAPGTYEFRLFANGYTRVATSATITVLPPAPSATSLSPATARVGGAAFALTVNGSNFTASSLVQWNGTDRATTYVSPSQLRAAILASDIASVGTATVTVFNPPPGGGTSAGLTFTINQGPSLSVSTTTAAGGSQVTVTLANGYGGSSDWLALATTTAPDTSYLQSTYIGAGVTNRTWTVTMPTSPGAYEFRLFVGGNTRAATSATVNVSAPLPPQLTTSVSTATVGTPVTVSLTGGYGGSSDWLALASTSAANEVYVQRVYVGYGITTRDWTVNMPAAPGTYEFRLFLNSGYTRAATSPPITVTP